MIGEPKVTAGPGCGGGGVATERGPETNVLSRTHDPAFVFGRRRRPARGRSEPHVDPVCASEVSAAFCDTPSRPGDPMTVGAYSELQDQSDRMFSALTGLGTGARVRFTRCVAPYSSDRELIDAVRSTKVLEVATVATERDRRHPLLDSAMGGAYDRFRAVHDLLGHVATGDGFDQEGEYRAWRAQSVMYAGLARWALATELHGENSVLCDIGQLAEHKAMLLRRDLLLRSYCGRSPAVTEWRPPD